MRAPNPFDRLAQEGGVFSGEEDAPHETADHQDPDAPKYRKRTMLRMAQMDKAKSYWKSQRHLSDRDWCAKHLKIVNKNQELVPFIFNPAQVILAEVIRDQLKRTGLVRIVILKARQLGMSLLVQALLWRDALENPNQKCIVMADEEDPADKVFERTRIFRDETRFIYPFKFSSRREVVFESPHRSAINVLVATHRGKGHGGTYSKLHLSEVAHWKNAKGNLTRLLGGFSDRPNTWAIWESTAKGIGGEFHDKYWAAKDGKAGHYVAVFLPWYIDPDYRIVGAKLTDYPAEPDVTEDEVALRALGCDDEQLAYRRHTINEKYNGDVDQWRQEMPATDREAFIAAGRCVFMPRQKVGNQLTELLVRDRKSPPVRAAIEPRGYEEWVRAQAERREPIGDKFFPKLDFRGYLWLYELPQHGRKYVIGADVAGGKEPENDDAKRGGDYSVAHVYDRESGRQVAVYRHRLEPDLYGCVLDVIGRYYNGALMIPEVNNHGLTVIQTLLRLNYPNLYLRVKVDVASAIHKVSADMYGWLSTSLSKTVGVGSFIRLYRTNGMMLCHANTLKEMSTFVHHPDGSMAASKSNFDDEVIASMICAVALETIPIEKPNTTTGPDVNSPAWCLEEIRRRREASAAYGGGGGGVIV